MFKTLGLFNHTRCPDESCHRPYCFFSHSISRNGFASGASTPTPASSAVRRDADGQAVKKRKVEAHESSSTRPGSVGPGDKPRAVADTRNAGGARPAATSSSSTGADRPVITKTTPAPGPTSTSSRSAPASASTAARPVAAAAAAPSTATTTGAPIIPRDAETLKASRQPYVERQKALTTLYTQFCKLYRPLGPNHPQLAAEHALAQEAEIAKEFPALDSYKRTIHHAAVSVLRRPAPDSVHHPSIGTLRESRAKVEKAAKEALSKLSKESCSRYVLPLSEYADWGYPDYADDSLITPPEVFPDATGTEQKCDRCQSPYIVSPVPASDEDKREKMGECKFHFGKLQPHMLEGRKKWLYSCCMRERGEPGCEDGLHVFRHKDDDPALARRVPYKRVKAVCDEIQRVQGPDKASASWLEVVAIDCEMIYTTGGLSVARATVVDEKGEVVLDEIVRQTTSIVDVNARFSGLTAEEVNKAVLDLDAVRKAVCMFIGPDTIIVGHGLENDLRALRLLHDKVIDTAILLPHAKGKPYRRALREIVREKLGYVIQNMISEKGHSSAEDAQATLDVLKWKVRDDATPVDQGMLRLDK